MDPARSGHVPLMHRTDTRTRSPLHRLAAGTLTALLTLTVLAGCGRQGQSEQPGQNENLVPGEATSTATPDTDYTDDDPGEDAVDGEETETVQPSPPQTIIAPEPDEESGSPESE